VKESAAVRPVSAEVVNREGMKVALDAGKVSH